MHPEDAVAALEDRRVFCVLTQLLKILFNLRLTQQDVRCKERIHFGSHLIGQIPVGQQVVVAPAGLHRALLASEHGPKGILAETLVHGFLSEAGELPQLIRHILHRICIVCTGSVYGVCITRQGGVGNQAWLWQHA